MKLPIITHKNFKTRHGSTYGLELNLYSTKVDEITLEIKYLYGAEIPEQPITKRIIYINLDTKKNNFTINIILSRNNEERFNNNYRNDFKELYLEIINLYFSVNENKYFCNRKSKRALESIELYFIELLGGIKQKYIIQYMNKIRKINIYDIILALFLDKKEIKPTDVIWFNIQHVKPKEKWLDKNDRKYLPAVLDEYKIKSKYFIKELSKTKQNLINIKSLKYLCNLFGENHLDYIKKIKWNDICCREHIYKLKSYTLKTDSEKKIMCDYLNYVDENKGDNVVFIITDIINLMSLREKIEKLNYFEDLKFTARDTDDFNSLLTKWSGIYKFLKRGYRLRHVFDKNFIEDVEQDIIIGDGVYKSKLILDESDFHLEGSKMKNCMGGNFTNGTRSIFFSIIDSNNTRVNIEYKDGIMKQARGKFNGAVPEYFIGAIEVLSKKMLGYKDIRWSTEKYSIIDSSPAESIKTTKPLN